MGPYFWLFHDGGRYPIETSHLLCKSMDLFLYDNGLRHERVNFHFNFFTYKIKIILKQNHFSQITSKALILWFDFRCIICIIGLQLSF